MKNRNKSSIFKCTNYFNGNKLMVAGPVEIEKDVRNSSALPMVYNRTPEFSKFLLDIEKGLKNIFRTKNDVLILSASGTGAMEAAVTNLLSPGDEALILSGGTFGYRWYEIARRYRVKCRLIKVPRGISVRPELIAKKITRKTKAVFVTANETSTGVLIDLERIGEIVKKTNAVLVVDAVSSLGADKLETDRWHCDVVISASQKALAIFPGLSFITISKKAWGLVEKSKIKKYYFDLKFYKKDLIRGQTPFTPPISLLYQLQMRLHKILEKGLDKIINEQRYKSIYLQKGLSALGLRVIGDHPSNGVVGILFPDGIDAFEAVQFLRKKFKIEITPSPGKDKSVIARCGLYGDLSTSDIDYLLNGLKQLLKHG